jgi:hypothetical protein
MRELTLLSGFYLVKSQMQAKTNIIHTVLLHFTGLFWTRIVKPYQKMS